MAEISLGEHDRIVFHGTNAHFENFDLSAAASLTDANADANGALGIHLTDEPGEAAEYAEAHGGREAGEPIVLAVIAPAENPYLDMDYYQFFGYENEEDAATDAAGFVWFRQALLRKGHDSVEYEDGEQHILVSLAPEKLRIVARLMPAEALDLQSKFEGLGEKERLDDHVRAQLLAEILNARKSPSTGNGSLSR